LKVWILPLSGWKTTKSVNVPPMSTPMRNELCVTDMNVSIGEGALFSKCQIFLESLARR